MASVDWIKNKGRTNEDFPEWLTLLDTMEKMLNIIISTLKRVESFEL